MKNFRWEMLNAFSPVSAGQAATQRCYAKVQRYLGFYLAKAGIYKINIGILKFAVSEQMRKFRRKIFFSGIFDTAQANFSWP